jgi:hypothetical protein
MESLVKTRLKTQLKRQAHAPRQPPGKTATLGLRSAVMLHTRYIVVCARRSGLRSAPSMLRREARCITTR